MARDSDFKTAVGLRVREAFSSSLRRPEAPPICRSENAYLDVWQQNSADIGLQNSPTAESRSQDAFVASRQDGVEGEPYRVHDNGSG